MEYNIIVDDKKSVVKRLEQLSGERAKYTRAPRFAYLIKGIAVEKDNTVTTEPDADMNLIHALESEGFIEAAVTDAPATDEEPVPSNEETEQSEERTEAESPEQEAPEAQTEDEQEASAPAEIAEVPIASTEESSNVESAETVEVNAPDDPEDTEEEAEEAEEAEEPVEAVITASEEIGSDSESVDDPYGDMIERIEPYRPTICFPLSQHRPESVCNLVFTIFSKGKLLSKSTGGKFYASDELVETLRSENFISINEVLEAIGEFESGELCGLSFDEEKVIFDGFPETDSKEEITAWTVLFEAINKTAIKQHHVQARQTEEINEKFSFRAWLTRLGMNGPELKAERLLLYKNLTGHVAFRTPADEEKWKARQAAKRHELRARKERQTEESEESGA